MKGPEALLNNMDVLRTSMGACFVGERAVFRGHDLHKDLKEMDWVELYVFGITGRRFTKEQLRLMHAMFTYTSYPDARIWNNRVAALAGSSRSTGNMGTAAALAVSEASIYGRGIDIRAITFLMRTRSSLEKGAELTSCIKKEMEISRGIAGYGRPLVSGDERIPPMMKLAKELQCADGPHMQLAFSIDQFLSAGRWRMRMNAAALWAALGADLGLSPREYYSFLCPTFLAGMLPCFIEASRNPEGTLFPMSCSDISYEGTAKRLWGEEGQKKEPSFEGS